MKNQYHLLATRRFLPLFLTQFCGAFNDNVFKNALVILIAFRLGGLEGSNAPMMITLAAGLFILPFFLFSSTAGQWADKYDKARLIRYIKATEIIIMALGAWGFLSTNIPYLMGILFLMGSQSAFFGPLKYAILPDHIKQDELLGGNGLIETGTFLAILLGTIIGGLMIIGPHGPTRVALLTITLAAIGWLISLAIPKTAPAMPELKVRYNLFRQTGASLTYFAHDRIVFTAILAISWFWFLGASILSQIPTYGQKVLLGDETVITLLLTAFSIGIGIGSLLCNSLLRGRISTHLVLMAMLGMSVFLLDLYFASPQGQTSTTPLYSADSFLQTWQHWRVLLDMTAIAIFGGLYIVPLYALIQSRVAADHRARAIASLNVMNALFMVLSSLLIMGLLSLTMEIPEIFLTLAVMNAALIPVLRRL